MAEFSLFEELGKTKPDAGFDLFDAMKEAEAGNPPPAVPEAVRQDLPPAAGLNEPGLRARLGFNDTTAEKQAAFQETYPEGQLFKGQGTEGLYYRKTPQDSAAPVDPGAFDQPGNVFSNIINNPEALSDVADFAGAVPPILGEAALMIPRKIPGPKILKAFAGAFAGESTKQGMQSALGTQRDEIGEQFGRAAQEGALAATGEALTKPLIGAMRLMKGGAALSLKTGARAAQRVADRLGLPGLTPGQAARSGLISRIEGQAGAMLKTIEEYVEKGATQTVSTIRRLGLKGSENLGQQLSNAAKGAENKVKRLISLSPVGNQRAGKAIKKGLQEWDDTAVANVNVKYNKARAAGTPTYDINDVKRVADEIAEGTPGLGQKETVEQTSDILDEFGRPMQLDPVETQKILQLEEAMEGELDRVIKDIRELQPDLPPAPSMQGPVDGTEQLNALRQRLWDLKTPPHRRAGHMAACQGG